MVDDERILVDVENMSPNELIKFMNPQIEELYYASIDIVSPIVGEFTRYSFSRLRAELGDTVVKEVEAACQFGSLSPMLAIFTHGLNNTEFKNTFEAIKSPFYLYHGEKYVDDFPFIFMDQVIEFNNLAIDLIDKVFSGEEPDFDLIKESILGQLDEFPKFDNVFKTDFLKVFELFQDEFLTDFIKDKDLEIDDVDVLREFLGDIHKSSLKVNILSLLEVTKELYNSMKTLSETDEGRLIASKLGNFAIQGLRERYTSENERLKISRMADTRNLDTPVDIRSSFRLRTQSILVNFTFGAQALHLCAKNPNYAKSFLESDNLDLVIDMFTQGATDIGGMNDLGKAGKNWPKARHLARCLKEKFKANKGADYKGSTLKEFFKSLPDIIDDDTALTWFFTLTKDAKQDEMNILLSLIDQQKVDFDTQWVLWEKYGQIAYDYYFSKGSNLEKLRANLNKAYGTYNREIMKTANLVNLFTGLNAYIYSKGKDYDTLKKDGLKLDKSTLFNIMTVNPLYRLIKIPEFWIDTVTDFLNKNFKIAKHE